MKASKIFNPKDYKAGKIAKLKTELESMYKQAQVNKIAFEYSDWNRAWEYAQLFLNSNPSKKVALDIGSGKSLLPILISRYAKKVVSVDKDDFVERGVLYKFFKARNIKIILADARTLPLKNKYFDVCYNGVRH